MGLRRPGSILVFESLDCRRRADTKREDEARGLAGDVWRYHQNSANKERSWPVDRTTENSGMGHGADRTLMAGKLGTVSVYVDGLDNADECHQEDTQQRQSCDGRLFVPARLVSR
jgi:hypothetical protein